MFGINLNSSVCEYKDTCLNYRDNSDTCNDALDKTYCGAYNRFVEVGGE